MSTSFLKILGAQSHVATGRLTSVRVPADSGKGHHERRYSYDSRRRTYTETDERGSRTVFRHDKEGRDLEVKSYAPGDSVPLLTVRNWYDNEGRTVMSRDPEGNLHRMKYDVQGRPMREVGPEGIETKRQYDLAGNVQWERTTGQGGSGHDSVVYSQDGAFRVVSAVWRDGQGTIVDSILTQWDTRTGYTRLGMPVGQQGPRGLAVEYTFDALARPLSTGRTVTGSGGQLYQSTQGYAYTPDGLLRTHTVSTNGTSAALGWKHDGLRRTQAGTVSRSMDTLAIASVTGRDASGLVTGIQLGNGTTISHQYESGRPLVKKAEAFRPGSSVSHWKMGLRYDSRGDIERMDRPDGERALYDHDALRRLVSATYSGGGSGADGTGPTYQWDHGKDGRRLGWKHMFGKDTVLYAQNSGMPVEHRLSDGLVRTIKYDHRGNRNLVRTYASTQTAQAAESLSNDTLWLSEERMEFDLRDGLRGYQKVTRGSDGSLDTIERHYLLDERGWRIAELDADSTILKRWIYRGNYVAADSGTTDGPSGHTGWKFYNGLGDQPQGMAYTGADGSLAGRWYLTDHLGSVSAVEDSAGSRTLTLSLDPWGNLEKAKGTEGVGYGYTGKSLDGLLGCSDHGARCLDNRMGMWWGRDKAGQWWNAYSYAGGQSLMRKDMDGNSSPFSVVVEVAGTTWDVYDAQATFSNSSSTGLDKSLTLVGLGIGLGLPGAGYGTALRNVFPKAKGAAGVVMDKAGSLLAKGKEMVLGKFGGKNAGVASQTKWPANYGFHGDLDIMTNATPGERLSRLGNTKGSFLSPAGTSFEARSLPGNKLDYVETNYLVTKPFPVRAGPAADAFGQPGMGIQYQTGEQGIWGSNIQQLIDAGSLKKVD